MRINDVLSVNEVYEKDIEMMRILYQKFIFKISSIQISRDANRSFQASSFQASSFQVEQLTSS